MRVKVGPQIIFYCTKLRNWKMKPNSKTLNLISTNKLANWTTCSYFSLIWDKTMKIRIIAPKLHVTDLFWFFWWISSNIELGLVKMELVCCCWVIGAPVVGGPTYFEEFGVVLISRGDYTFLETLHQTNWTPFTMFFPIYGCVLLFYPQSLHFYSFLSLLSNSLTILLIFVHCVTLLLLCVCVSSSFCLFFCHYSSSPIFWISLFPSKWFPWVCVVYVIECCI